MGLAQMLKGGVIMDVMNVEQAKVAEAAGAVAVMALERIPADIRRDGGVARMSDPAMILEIKNAVTIPVMAKVGTDKVKMGLAQMLKGGVIMDVMNVEQAKVAEAA